MANRRDGEIVELGRIRRRSPAVPHRCDRCARVWRRGRPPEVLAGRRRFTPVGRRGRRRSRSARRRVELDDAVQVGILADRRSRRRRRSRNRSVRQSARNSSRGADWHRRGQISKQAPGWIGLRRRHAPTGRDHDGVDAGQVARACAPMPSASRHHAPDEVRRPPPCPRERCPASSPTSSDAASGPRHGVSMRPLAGSMRYRHAQLSATRAAGPQRRRRVRAHAGSAPAETAPRAALDAAAAPAPTTAAPMAPALTTPRRRRATPLASRRGPHRRMLRCGSVSCGRRYAPAACRNPAAALCRPGTLPTPR